MMLVLLQFFWRNEEVTKKFVAWLAVKRIDKEILTKTNTYLFQMLKVLFWTVPHKKKGGLWGFCFVNGRKIQSFMNQRSFLIKERGLT